ncbi:MAG: ABC transporter substrate-binding protein [Betaproteobacteria bacterium]|nr:ABC transporter substrate-binding protein [Betaproteobacteria bacterium]
MSKTDFAAPATGRVAGGPHDPGRRDFLGRAAALAVGLSAGLAGRETAAAAADVETINVNDRLIEAAKREGSLTVRYSSPVDEMRAMGGAFQARFGVKVQMDRKVGVLGSQQFATEERAGQHVMDLNYSADPAGIRDLAEEGYYLRYTLADLDKKLDKGTYLPGLGYSPKWTEIVISYNPDHIPHVQAKQMFKTWRGLLDPKLKGRIGLNEPAGGGVPFATFLMFYRRPEYGRKFLEQVAAQNPRLYPGSAPGREDLAAGAISVFIPNWESIAMVHFLKGDKTAWTYPEIAPAFANTYLAISRRAPHPNTARLFAAWFFTPEGARAMQNVQARPTLKGVPDERAVIARLKQTDWWQPYPEKIRWVPDVNDWDENYDKLMPDMRRVLGWKR